MGPVLRIKVNSRIESATTYSAKGTFNFSNLLLLNQSSPFYQAVIKSPAELLFHVDQCNRTDHAAPQGFPPFY